MNLSSCSTQPPTPDAVFERPLPIGKHLVTPFAKRTGEGGFQASVSIRSQHRPSSLDRVFRFTPLFDDAQPACLFALEQAVKHLQASASTDSTDETWAEAHRQISIRRDRSAACHAL